MNTASKMSIDDKRIQEIANTEFGISIDQTLHKKLNIQEVVTTQKAEMYTDIAAPKVMRRVPEGGLSNTADIMQGFISVIPWQEYHVSYSISYDQMKMDFKKVLIKEAQDQATVVAQAQDEAFGGIMRRAFETPLADGVSLIHPSHPLKVGGTTANTFTDTQKALSYASLGEATEIFNVRMKNHAGERVARKSRKLTLLVPNSASIVDTAFQLVIGNMQGLKPGTDKNDANLYQKYEGVQYNLIVSDILTRAVALQQGETTTDYSASLGLYETMWFLVDEAMLPMAFKKITLQDSQMKMRVTEERNLSTTFDIFSFFGFGATSIAPFAIFGSRGNNLAF